MNATIIAIGNDFKVDIMNNVLIGNLRKWAIAKVCSKTCKQLLI